MSVLVKTKNGIAVEAYGFKLGTFELGDMFPYTPENGFGDIDYFHIYTTEGTHAVTRVSEGQYNTNISKLASNIKWLDMSNGQIYFRYHRGGLVNSMKTAFEVKDLKSLKQTIIKDSDYINPFGKMKTEKYGQQGKDERIGWDTHIVSWDGTPIGFLSGELK